jgi:hypothetical protein
MNLALFVIKFGTLSSTLLSLCENGGLNTFFLLPNYCFSFSVFSFFFSFFFSLLPLLSISHSNYLL